RVARSLTLTLRRIELDGTGSALTETRNVTRSFPWPGIPQSLHVESVDLAALGRNDHVVTGLMLKGGSDGEVAVRARRIWGDGRLGLEETFFSGGVALPASSMDVDLRAGPDRIVTGIGVGMVDGAFVAGLRDDLPSPYS